MSAYLADVVHVRRRFQRSVRVDTDISIPALEGFVCPQSAADALTAMARQIHESGQGAFTWTGPYGCGKSSLAVALAALLGRPDLKVQARRALGPKVAGKIERLLDPQSAGWTVIPIVGSRSNPASTISAFLDAPDAASGASGRKRAKQTLIERLSDLAAKPSHGGVLLVIDEMGKFLEEAAFGTGGDVFFFQQLAEAANRSQGRLVVIGVLHQAFDDYAHRLSREARDEWLKIQGRFADIPINVAGEEQIELIARAVECEASPADNRAVAEGIAASVSAFRPGTAVDLADRLHECWPLHPVVACLLGPLSRRRFGQNQRSVFGFLNSAEPFGFQQHLKSEPLEGAGTYNAFHLWEYLRANLEPSILASPDGHRWSLAVDAIERSDARGADADHLAVLKTIALIDLFKERSGLAPSLAVLQMACPKLSAARLETCIEDLKAWSVILFRKHLGAYAIFAGSDFDIDAAVTETRAQMSAIDLAKVRTLARLQPVLAKRHYHTTGALRWFEVDIAPLSNGIERVQQFRPQNGAAGLFLLLIGTEAESEAKAKKLWRAAADGADDAPVAVGWTRDSFMLRELAGELLALEAVRSQRSELNGDAVARREVNARIARLSAEIEDRLGLAFESAKWAWRGTGGLEVAEGAQGLNAIASHLADRRYADGPMIRNELLNRLKPSSNAIAAQKELLKAMVERSAEERLGIEGYPASGGLYDSLLGATRLHGPDFDRPGRYRFSDPSDEGAHRLAPLWQVFETVIKAAGAAGASLATVYDEWRKPPFGMRDGLMPVFAIAYVMARSGKVAIYLDGAFQSKIGSLLIDRLTQDPSSVRLRWTETSDFHARVLSGVADLVATHGAMAADVTHPETLDVARGLVGLVLGLPGWVLRTNRLSPIAAKVRNLAKLASDPNKFLLDDLPTIFGEGDVSADAVVSALRHGLQELIDAYPAMLRDLETTMLRELRIDSLTDAASWALAARAKAVSGLTGNYRLDAFANRIATYKGEQDDMEGFGSLAANKPSRDWIDRDIDQARIELASLAQEFVKAEAFAHVKGRGDGRVRMAIFTSDPTRPSPLKPDFDIEALQHGEVRELADRLEQIISLSTPNRDVALAALAELGMRLMEQGQPKPADAIEDKITPIRKKASVR